MYLLPNEEQQQLAAAAAEFLAGEMSTALIRERRHEAAAVPPRLWEQCAELGLLALGLPEEHGGLGAGLAEESLVFREIGRIPSPGPFLSSVLAGHVAARSGAADLTDGIVSGRTPVGLMLLKDATIDASGVTGTVDLLDVTPGGPALVFGEKETALVDTSDQGDLTAVQSLDPALRIATGHMHGARLIHSVASDADPLHLRGKVLAAALLAGVAEGSLRASVRHAKLREQFGRPIGVNQAIKHACADMAVRAEAAMSQTNFAAAALDGGREDAEFQATTALVIAGRAARENAAANVQIHGGMGFTFEVDAHLYVKRAEVLTQVVGNRAIQLERLLALPGPS